MGPCIEFPHEHTTHRRAKLRKNVMGPFPHDAPPAKITEDNPAGTDGFEFVEFAHPDPKEARNSFPRWVTPVARHKTKNITVWRQGDINYILNAEPGSFAMRFVESTAPARRPWPGAWSMRKHAFDHAVSKGATPYEADDKTLDVPAIVGIGGSLLYFVDTYGDGLAL
jgi:4-hydroxyphenylpyruvate dioxygenase